MGDEEVSKDHIIQEQEMTIKAYHRELKELRKLVKEQEEEIKRLQNKK